MKSKEKTSILHEWADTTTAHGFHDFFKAKSVVAKLIWFFLITVSLTLMTYQLFRLISEYNRKLWSTTIEEISADSLPLPSLVVCNVNRIKKSRAEQYGLTDDLLHYIFMHMDTQYQVKSYDLSAEAAFIEWRTAYNFSYMDIFDKLAHSFQDIFISSGIIDKVFVKQPIDTLDYGRCQCYDANRSSTVVGTKGGLTLVLDTQGYEYLPLFYDNHLYEGVAVKMAYNCRVEVGQWIILQPATRVSLGMQLYEKTLRESERSPYNPFSYLASEPPCERDPKLMFSDNALGRYTVENCMKECEWLRAVRQCNCIPYMKNEQYRTCEVDELRKCQGDNVSLQFFDQYNGSISTEILSEIDSCRSTCKKPCFDKYVDVQISMTRAPSQAQVDTGHLIRLVMAYTGRYARIEDLTMLDVYFNSLSVKSIQLFEVITLESLVSNAGGLIGLWAGMSFLTVFQAIDYFIFYLKIRMLKGIEGRIRPTVSSDAVYRIDKDEF